MRSEMIAMKSKISNSIFLHVAANKMQSRV